MKLSDIAKLAQNATGATPIGLAAEAVSQLARIADAVQTIATHMTRDDNPMHWRLVYDPPSPPRPEVGRHR